MKRLASLILLLALLPGLGRGTALDRARLLDWYYPSEPAYQELLKVATAQSRGGWLVREMQAGKPIPQASAKELALDFIQGAGTSAQDKQDLKALFKPESVAATTASSSEMGGVGELEKKFAQLNEQMNELEATIKKNNYNKQSYPSAGAKVNYAYVSNGASGLLAGQNRGNFLGGISVNFNGQGDAGSWSFGVGENIDSGGVGGGAVSQHGTMSVSGSPNFQIGYSDATLSVNLGGGGSYQRTALALASVAAPGAPNNFYINYQGGDITPNYTMGELKLGMPAGTWWIPQIFSFSKQGTAKYWPFQVTEVFFGPDGYGYTDTWGSRQILWGTDFQMDMGSLWGMVDHQLFLGALVGKEGDQDLLQSFKGGLGDTSYSHRSWAVETDTLTFWGGRLYMDYGQASVLDMYGDYEFSAANKNTSAIVGYPDGVVKKGFQRRYDDSAFVVVYDQPVGLMTFGLEYSKIGPLFEPIVGAVSPSSILGPGNSIFTTIPNPGNKLYSPTPWVNPPSPGGYMENGKVIVDSTRDIAWGTNASVATGLMSNTEKVVLQTQFSWSFISLGLFDGIASQINPTGPWLQTMPSFESGNGGDLFVSRFIPGWAEGAPLPGAAAPPFATALYYQWAFDHWTDGKAVDVASGKTFDVHWNQLISTGGSAKYMVFFTKNGVGDKRFDSFNQKYLNYLAFTLKLDIQSLLGRTLPFDIQFYGQSTDVAPAPGLAHFGDPGKPGSADMIYWNQTNESLFIRYGWSQTLTFIGILRSEDWHSNHSYLPVYITMLEYGAGFDIDANKLLSGLGFSFRSRIFQLEDHNIGGRALGVWETSAGSSLSF